MWRIHFSKDNCKNSNCHGFSRPFPVCRAQFNRRFSVVLNAVNCVLVMYTNKACSVLKAIIAFVTFRI